MTDEQLAEIEARERAATPGPWIATCHRMVETEDLRDLDGEQDRLDICEVLHYRGGPPAPGDATAEFIAHARADVPALLAEVRQLRAERLTIAEAKALRATYMGDRFDMKAINRAETKLAAIIGGKP